MGVSRMTQEQKDKMEQEVRAYTIPYIRNHGQRMGDIVKQDFTSIYQNILDNPVEWGLVRQVWEKRAEKTITALELIVKKYEDNRIVLDAGLETALEMEMYLLAKEALKQ